MKLVSYDAKTGSDEDRGELCVDIWDDANANHPHPVVRVYFADGDHDRVNLIQHIMQYTASDTTKVKKLKN